MHLAIFAVAGPIITGLAFGGLIPLPLPPVAYAGISSSTPILAGFLAHHLKLTRGNEQEVNPALPADARPPAEVPNRMPDRVQPSKPVADGAGPEGLPSYPAPAYDANPVASAPAFEDVV